MSTDARTDSLEQVMYDHLVACRHPGLEPGCEHCEEFSRLYRLVRYSASNLGRCRSCGANTPANELSAYGGSCEDCAMAELPAGCSPGELNRCGGHRTRDLTRRVERKRL